jgi:rod shape-determining protein MreC
VKKNTDQGSTRLVRIWAVTLITPLEKAVVHSVSGVSQAWHHYVYLRDVRRENDALRGEIQRLRLEQVRMAQDAGQARRLQMLLGFKEQFISQTLPAQVISTTGSEFSRGVYIDKGSRDGIKPDMPVITADGVVGKVYRVYPTSSLVLEINDPSSGAGVILEKSRLQGILKGSPNGQTFVANIMADEQVQPGEQVLTSGGDRVYPKGLAVGTVTKVFGAGTFLNVQVRPAARLDRLEEVLVITKIVERAPEANEASAPVRAIDILAERLPSVPPPKPPEDKTKAAGTGAAPVGAKPAAGAAASTGTGAKPATPAEKKPAAPGATVVTNPTAQPAKPAGAGTTTSKPAPKVSEPVAGNATATKVTTDEAPPNKPKSSGSVPGAGPQPSKKPSADVAKPEKPGDARPEPPRENEH